MRVKEFYRDRKVLVTGATGYVGSVLVQRLLSFAEPEAVLLLVRPRAGLLPAERLSRLLQSPLFQDTDEAARSKLRLVEGDLSLPGLGLNPSDLAELSSVEVVFHVAASINFSSPLDRAVAVNLTGTAAVLDLVKSLPCLQAFVHVSTAFANCTEKRVMDEKIYLNKWMPRELVKTLQGLSSSYIRQREKEFLGNHPNTYSFTKQLSENLLFFEGSHLPIAIVRPSMVLCTSDTPLAGWLENVQTGTFGFIAGASRGVFRTIRVNPDVRGDWVPADYFAAFLIAAAWKVSKLRRLEVYHYTCGPERRPLWSDVVRTIMAKIEENPTTNAVLYPVAKARHSPLRDWFVTLVFHYLPAAIIDSLVTLKDAPAKILEVQRKYARGSMYASYFTSYDWVFRNDKAEELWNELDKKEQRELWFSMEGFNWTRYWRICVLGVREFYHGQSPASIPQARIRSRKLKLIYYASWTVFFFLMLFALEFFITSSSSCLLLSLFITSFLYWV